MMTRRLILTIEQARDLQKETAQQEDNEKWVWPGKWKDAFRLIPQKVPHISVAKERIAVAVTMLEWGCSVEQIILQINWLPHAEGLQTAIARHERNSRKLAPHIPIEEIPVEKALAVDTVEEPCRQRRVRMNWRRA